MDQINSNIEKAKKDLRDLRQNVKAVRSTQAHLLGADSANVKRAFQAIAQDEPVEEDATAEQSRAASSGQEVQVHQVQDEFLEGMDSVFEGFD